MRIKNSNRIWYNDDARLARFLMGGIGTGNFSIDSRGALCDWEIYNNPRKGAELSYSFFAIRTENEDGDVQTKVLEGRLKPPYERANGYEPVMNAGVPRFEHSKIAGEVSAAMVELRDELMPVDVDLFAFSPFIPLNPDDSGIPGAILRYKVTNKSDKAQTISLVGSLGNGVGYQKRGLFGGVVTKGRTHNQYREDHQLKGIYMTNPELEEDDLSFGTMSLLTTEKEGISTKTCWMKSSFWDGPHEFWDDFISDGELNELSPEDDHILNPHFDAAKLSIGAVCKKFTLQPNESKEVEFMITWHFPNRPHRWPGMMFKNEEDGRIVKNHYVKQFKDAWEVGSYLVENMQRLEKATDDFRGALYSTTIPSPMIEAMAANITVLRSNTCFWLEDGTFLGWEGTFDTHGSCEGNCNHVWGYQQALAFLFPSLERDMRRVNFLMETSEEGDMAYRSNTMFGYPRFTKIPPAADGQMMTIVQLYRDWKLSGDDAFLKAMWEKAVKALEYAFTEWDTDGDFVFDGEQHNTFDIEFYGINAYTNILFYAALKAAQEMAAYLGENERAEKYHEAWQKGSTKMDELLFNGEYYIQKLENSENYYYQFGEGCLANQLFGQQLAHTAGLGYLLPEDHIKKTLKSIYQNNFKEAMYEHINVQRVYALNDDAGLIVCSWPEGNKPKIPFIYSDEVWSGFEYSLATHMIYEGFYEEALTLVEAVRNRHDGIKHSPWNEVECGNHYVRAMASWGLLPAASGYKYDLTKNEVSFAPKYSSENFSAFFSTGKNWGIYKQQMVDGELKKEIEILYGDKDAVSLVEN